MDNFQIETAQNVSIFQNVAGIGDRILAYLIDSLLVVIYFIFLLMIFVSLDLDFENQWSYLLIMGLPPFLYYVLWETFWDGKTPGKSAMKLRVVKLDGSKPSFSNYLVRWLLRIIDISLASGSIAVVSILMNGKGQRLGDLAANTTVISEKHHVRFRDTIHVEIPEGYQSKYPQVTVFSDAEMRKIKNLFTTAKRGGNHNVILELSDKVASLMGVTPEEKPVDFVTKVISDYNYFTQKN